MSGRRLGEILLEHGWITRADLGRALKSQQLVGGRLGTCLLEGEVISEELLGQALAEQFGVPAASIEDLRQVEADTLALLPRRLAVRCRAIPLHATGSRLDLATANPGNFACQDEIAFATSRRLVVRVASEARIVEALQRYYDEAPAGRFVGLIDRLDRQRDAWRAAAAGGGEGATGAAEVLGAIEEGGGPAGAAAARGERGAGPPAAAAAGDSAPPAQGRTRRPAAVTLSETERAELLGAAGAAGPRGVPAPPRRDPTTIAAAVGQLAEATTRDEVGRILTAYLRQLFDRVVLLAVRRDGVRGWLGAGDGVDRERLDDLVIPFDRPSVFLNLRQGSPLHLGTLPPMPAHRPLLAVLGGDPPGPCLLLPVQVGGRMAAAIYGDREGAPVGGIDLDGLRRLAKQAGFALERCISLKRKAHSGPAAG